MARFTGGWVKLHRRVFNTWVGKDGYAFGVLGVLMSYANPEDGTELINGRLAPLKRGQVLTSAQQIAADLGWSRKIVAHRLELLEKHGTIVQQTSTHGRIITLCKYDEYQGSSEDDGQTDGQPREQPEGRPRVRQDAHIGKKQETRNKKEDNFMSPDRSGQATQPTPTELASLWNELKSPNQPEIKLGTFKPGARRWTWAQKRLVDAPDLSYWREIIQRIAKSTWCNGGNDRGWVADFEFLVRQETHVKVTEGKYDDRDGGSSGMSQSDWDKVFASSEKAQ